MNYSQEKSMTVNCKMTQMFKLTDKNFKTANIITMIKDIKEYVFDENKYT